jgi:hypothetical protein
LLQGRGQTKEIYKGRKLHDLLKKSKDLLYPQLREGGFRCIFATELLLFPLTEQTLSHESLSIIFKKEMALIYEN